MARPIWVADSETEGFKYRRIPRPFIWGAYDGCTYREFHSTAAFVEFFRDKDVIVYAHNGGKFDWMFLISELEAFQPLMVISGRLARFKIGACEFRDSYNILPVPLSAYKKDDIDYSLFEPEERVKPENWRKICDYLRSDCIYLFELVSGFIAKYGNSLTLAGAAMKTWAKMAEQQTPKTDAAFYGDLSPFYYGGRVECFQRGLIKSPFKVLDLNSAYPDAMKRRHAWGSAYDVSDELPNSRAYIERSFIKLRCDSRGAFPYRAKDNSLYFPNDSLPREYCVTGWEFLAAIETRTIRDWEIIEVFSFSDSMDFGTYVDHFYAEKSLAARGSPEFIYAKLFLNSLYGKLGANPTKYDEYMVVRPQYVEAASLDGYEFCAEVDRWALVARPLPDYKHHFYNLATAASVTGYVRAKLWRAICQCEGVIYCDTDSIVCADPGELPLDPIALGAWDMEAECDYGAVAGKKLYAFHTTDGKWKKASKGVKLTPKQIIRVANGGTAFYKPDAPTFSIKRGIHIFGEMAEDDSNLDKMFQVRKVTMRR